MCATAAWTRTQLVVLFAVLALGLLWLAWESEPVRRWRSAWTRWDWAGAITLAVGAVLAFSALMGHLSTSWRETTLIFKDRIFEHATWAVGALGIGIGVIPLIVGVAALARPKSEPRDPETRAFVVTSAAALGAFAWYAGIKGAYVSTVFATHVYERNVIYLAPLLFAGTALALTRGVGRVWAIAVAATFNALRRQRRPDRARLPVLRGPRPCDPRVREPRARLVRRDDRRVPSSSYRSSRSPSWSRFGSCGASRLRSACSQLWQRSSWSRGA